MTFDLLNPEKIWHTNLAYLSISPVRCSHFTFGNPKKSFSIVLFIHTSHYLGYFRRKLTVIHLSTPPENVTTLTCELQNFFIRLKVCCVLWKRWRVWREQVVVCHRLLWKEPVVMRGNWNARQATLQQVFSGTTFCINTYFQSFVDTDQSHSTLRCAEIQPTSQQAAAASLVHINTRAPPVACPRRNTGAVQIIGSTKQQ